VTLRRYPDGVDGESFFEKNAPGHAPDWVRTARVPTPGSAKGNDYADFVLADDLPTLVWLANLAALELHVPQWTAAGGGRRRDPDLLVFDLDPGQPATIVDCARVAEVLRGVLAEDGLTAFPKTSGAKGMQLYVAVSVANADDTAHYAKVIAVRLAKQYPKNVLASMAKAQRTGKVFIDWSQNNPAKTTVAPYSLRARAIPTVSTPLTWHEVESCRRPEDLVFTADEVRDRVAEHGDLFGGLHAEHPMLPTGR
jgi:bifunctional non-homologous end joining protein LigD